MKSRLIHKVITEGPKKQADGKCIMGVHDFVPFVED